MHPYHAYLTLGETPIAPEKGMGISSSGQPAFNGQNYSGLLSLFFDSELSTTFFHHREGWVPSGSRLLVPVMSGVGAEASHAGSVFSLLNLLMSPKTGGVMSEIKADPNFTPVAGFTFDLPNSGTAFRSPAFVDLELNLDWMQHALLKPLNSSPKGTDRLPYLPIARSASPSLFMELHQRHPDLLKGLIATSPLHPQDLDVGNRTLEKLRRERNYRANEEAVAWVDALNRQMTWHEKADPFINDLPVLILVGQADPEETEALAPKVGWKAYREWERKFPHKVRFIIVKGAGHDLFSTREKQVLISVMKYVHRMFRFVLNGEKDMAAAFPVEDCEFREEQ